jgi:hypothetical protein
MPLESSSVHRLDYHLGDQVVDCGQKNKGPILNLCSGTPSGALGEWGGELSFKG